MKIERDRHKPLWVPFALIGAVAGATLFALWLGNRVLALLS